jgi:transposase
MGCKRHVITDANGLPLVIKTTPANLHDSKPALDLLDSIPPIQGTVGRPRFRPDIFQGDAAYGVPRNILGTKQRGITSQLALHAQRKAVQKHGSGLGKFRYVVERVMVWLGHNRRLKICYEKTAAHFQAFHDLAASLICARRLASCGL